MCVLVHLCVRFNFACWVGRMRADFSIIHRHMSTPGGLREMKHSFCTAMASLWRNVNSAYTEEGGMKGSKEVESVLYTTPTQSCPHLSPPLKCQTFIYGFMPVHTCPPRHTKCCEIHRSLKGLTQETWVILVTGHIGSTFHIKQEAHECVNKV